MGQVPAINAPLIPTLTPIFQISRRTSMATNENSNSPTIDQAAAQVNATTQANAPAQGAAATPPANSTRRKALTAVTALVVAGGIGYGAYWWLVLNHFESTDNAYVQGNVVQITPQVSGTVVAINADDTDHVKAGQVVVKLDPADARVALDQAEAQLAQTVREVRTVYANNSTLRSQITVREAELK